MIFNAAFIEAKISSKKTDKGIEVFHGKKKVGTIVKVPEGIRYVYPKGSEYTHTTSYGKTDIDMYVYETKLSILMSVVCDEREKICRTCR
jgi:hypothetical protein